MTLLEHHELLPDSKSALSELRNQEFDKSAQLRWLGLAANDAVNLLV